MSQVYNFYANGEWKVSETGELIEIITPYSNEHVGQVQAISKNEVDAIVKSAKEAQGEWAE
ncbi:MAG: aldehyde dehydrogenase family protein, partial [Enterococcus sp.]